MTKNKKHKKKQEQKTKKTKNTKPKTKNKHIFQNDSMHQKGRSDTKRYNIRQRIEFTPKGALQSAHPCHAPVQKIKQTGEKDEKQRPIDHRCEIRPQRIGLNDVRQGHKTTEQIACSHQIREHIDLQPSIGRADHVPNRSAL